jgi:hypothetical protein
MTTTQGSRPAGEASETRRLGKRMEEIAWALILIMSGALWLAPDASVPEGTWLAGFGLILLGLNAARRLYGLRMSGFGLIVGSCALAAGVGRILGRDLPYIPILLIVLGAGLIIAAVSGRKKDDGAANAS